MATRFGVNEAEVLSTLKATAFKGPVSDGQMTALMIVANQYGLNPWTKEIYAFPDKNNGIVPVVGLDGWSRIINEHPQFDGLDFNEAEDCAWIECVIHRKDRSHPIKVREYMAECKRQGGPWLSHPRRMLRHKAMIQCARIAFGYVGIFDQDEAERIVESPGREMGSVEVVDLPLAAKWVDLVADQNDAATLKDLWSEGVKEIRAEKDMAAYNAFKSAVEARRKELEA